MARKEDNTGRNFALGAIIAGVAGYLAGILTAPQSGKETREDMTDRVTEVKENTQQQLQDAHDEVDNLIKSTKGKTLALSAKAREEYDESVMKAKDARNKGASLLKALKAGEADDPELNKAIKQLKLAQKNLSKYLKG